jgi:hypothetical protein
VLRPAAERLSSARSVRPERQIRAPRALVDAAHGHAREQPEGRGPAGHAREIAHQGALDLLPALAVGRAPPGLDVVDQAGRGDEQGLAHLGAIDGPAQALAHAGAVLGRGAMHTGTPGQKLVEGEERGTQHEARIDTQRTLMCCGRRCGR